MISIKIQHKLFLFTLIVGIVWGLILLYSAQAVHADAPNISVYVYVDGQRFNSGGSTYYVELHSGPTQWQKEAWGAAGKNTWGTVWYRTIDSSGRAYFPSWQRNFPVDNYCYDFMMSSPGCRYDCRNRPKIDHDAKSSTTKVYNAFALTSGYNNQAKITDGNDWHNAWCYSDGYGCGSLSIPNIGVANRFKAMLPSSQYNCTYANVNNVNNSQRSMSVNVYCTSINRPPNVQNISATGTACNISGTKWSGSSVGNPMTFRVRYQDQDGVEDIRQVGFEIDGVRFLENVANGNVVCHQTSQGGMRLMGCSVSRSGNRLIVDWQVRFNTKEGANLPVRGYVSDGIANSGWKRLLRWNVDITPPSGSAATSIQSATQLNILWSVSDTLSRIYRVDRDCGTNVSDYSQCDCNGASCFSNRNSWTNPYRTDPVRNPGTSWTHTDTDTIPRLATLGDVQFRANVRDKACNNATLNTTKGLGGRWMRTASGDVFSQAGFSIPIPSLTDERDFSSTYIASYYSTPELFGAGGASNSLFKLYEYSDTNALKDSFYDFLWKLAESNLGEISSASSWPLGGNGVYVWTGGNLELNNATCNRRAVIFVPSQHQLSIWPEFRRVGDSNGCVFITKRRIRILAGNSKSNTYSVPGYPGNSVKNDRIDAFLISDNTVIIRPDTKNEQLFIHGGVIAKDVKFQRDLVLEDNLIFSAERIQYDARYLDILKKYLGMGYSFRVREYGFTK